MQNTNNYVPTIIERDARVAARIGTGGRADLSYWKAKAHRAYRRKMRTQLHIIAKGFLDAYEYDDTSIGTSHCSGWDID